MDNKDISPTIQDFSLIKSYVKKTMEDNGFGDEALAFVFFSLDLILNLQSDEIEDSITDNYYQKKKGGAGGHDRGIDAIYIDSSSTTSTIHLFSFKYANNFDCAKKHFPSNEIDKIATFLNSLMQRDESLKDEVNKVLFSKIQEIWSIFEIQSPNFVIHICSNYFQDFENSEKRRFEKEIYKYSYFQIEYHSILYFVEKLTRRGKKIVNGKIKAIDKNFFEKSDGDIRALIVNVDACDLLRMIIDNDELRNKVDIVDFSIMRNYEIIPDAFEDNVRIYLKQRTRINRNIKYTATTDESHRFFYYNNGITITCKKYKYSKGQRSPIIEIESLQIVNGSQTVYALFEAFKDAPEKFEHIDILCRIYETDNAILSTSIAEYTNSQNPVKSRDIRSNDYTQKKLEAELKVHGYFYERKKGQHQKESKSKRIDAEKAGQVLMTFFNKFPSEAKDKKRIIFADEMYDKIFNDDINADKLLLAYLLFEKIENAKKEKREKLINNRDDLGQDELELKYFILHASYYILYLLSELAEIKLIPLELHNIDEIWAGYEDTLKYLEEAIKAEQTEIEPSNEIYNHRVFFKSNRPKVHLDKILGAKRGQPRKSHE